jgi:hypothetical protein
MSLIYLGLDPKYDLTLDLFEIKFLLLSEESVLNIDNYEIKIHYVNYNNKHKEIEVFVYTYFKENYEMRLFRNGILKTTKYRKK